MRDETQGTLKELVVSTLAMTDALANLMIANGIITDLEKAFELGGNWRRRLY